MEDFAIIERRKEERYRTGEDAFAAIENSGAAGRIKDISKGGLCFKYIDDNSDDESRIPIDSALFLVSLASFVGELRFQVVRDYPILNVTPFSSMVFRKCHLQFGELDGQKRLDLDNYIQKNVF